RSFWLSLYFAFNLILTLYNKAVLDSFPFPYVLTAIHSLCAAIGGRVLLSHGAYRPKSLTFPDHLVLALFSALYSINIAVSNASLKLVTIPLHQVIRGTTPIFTTILAFYLLNARVTGHKLAALVPVVIGVGLATFGNYRSTFWGFSLTLLGAVLAAMKTVATNLLQASSRSPAPFHRRAPLRARALSLSIVIPFPPSLRFPRLNLHPLDLLTRMSPFAFAQCLLYAHLSGELDVLRHRSPRDLFPSFLHAHPWMYPAILIANGVIAFGLNVVSFEANRRAGAVAMGVASNVKQVLTILCAVSLFELSLSYANVTGILLTLVGGAWYAAVEQAEK
ncbi:TPT-domain-containing protein, partial [Vararia minispora EC-137]